MYQLYYEAEASTFIKLRKLQWAGHVERTEERKSLIRALKSKASGDRSLYQVPGYTLPTCMKCSEHLTSKFVSATYQSVREDAVSQHLQDEQVQTQEQNSSDILHSEIASQTERHLEKDENTSHINQPLNVKKIDSVPFDLERTLHNLDVDIVFNEEGSCPLCSKTFSRKSSLLTHIRNHSAERKYACAYCQKGFTQAANLRNHERIHTNDRPYVCGDCGKAFTQITNLNNHRRLHTGERPFVCIEPECGRSFAQVTNLNNHMKTHHKVQQYCCNQCSKKFTQVTSLNQHLQAHAGITGYYCPRCPEKTFKQQSQIHSHMKTHGLAFPYECQKCDEKFLQQAHLDQHNKMHDEFKFKCDMCPSSFNQDSLLKKHVQRHIDGRYITCPVVGCQQGFTAKQHLSKHLLTRHSYSELPPPKRSKKHQLLDYQQINIKSQNEVNKKKKNIYKSNVNLKYIGNLSNTMSSVTNEERSGTTHSSPTNSQEVVNENLKCNDCSLNFTDDNELREHIFYKHPERRFMQAILEENKYLLKIQNQFVCNICSNVFKSHLALVRHTAKFHAQFL